jgi:hypothetical protein
MELANVPGGYLKWILLFALVSPTFAHDDNHETDWIGEFRERADSQQQGLKNHAGELCCGKDDCQVIPKEWVKPEKDGLHIHVKAWMPADDGRVTGHPKADSSWEEWDEVWDYKQIIDNPHDGKTYRCAWPTPQNRRCLIWGSMGS